MSISIHKALAGLDIILCPGKPSIDISIHKALAGLDEISKRGMCGYCDFNPQGPRGPRLERSQASGSDTDISIHKALAGLDSLPTVSAIWIAYFNPQGPRGPRQQNYPTIPPHPPNFLCIMSSPPYFNLLHPFTQPIFTAFPLFFRCESPRHFMLAWHSHLV